MNKKRENLISEILSFCCAPRYISHELLYKGHEKYAFKAPYILFFLEPATVSAAIALPDIDNAPATKPMPFTILFFSFIYL
ncbi:hypothetical protein HQN84_25855 [Pedobacter steynii]|uniref:hypothetical protein n=1 Tax=Pedobacter steynii TaxID=430522 RepID=UPI00115FB40D|nr:hypothetical protein [Pedobacter steynii]NQX42306.1 hypothetical protein [Pedobacter steynii]